MSIVNRQELKYFVKKTDLPLITAFLESALVRDFYSINSSYKISSLYFDTICSSYVFPVWIEGH